MIKLEPIKGDKVILREFELDDAEQLYENWRKGIMSEAIKLLVDYYFRYYELVRISAEAI